jgi:hypothetical protein
MVERRVEVGRGKGKAGRDESKKKKKNHPILNLELFHHFNT